MDVAPAVNWPGLALVDDFRRGMGRALDGLGWGPVETPSRVAFGEPGVRLRAYGGSGPNLLLVPAPIKGAYIWDLSPGRSVVARALAAGYRVFVVVWQPAEHGDLDDYTGRLLGDCREAIAAHTGDRRLFLAGHSLGGTLAAISACLDAREVLGLVLVGAPLDFAAGKDAMAALVAALPVADLPPGAVPGALLNSAALAAAPLTFGCVPWLDRLFGGFDPVDRDTLLRVERWSLDELPMPATLVADVARRLYGENALVRGKLTIGGRRVAIEEFAAPILAVVDGRCPLVPPPAVEPFLRAVGSGERRQLRYHGDSGVLLQHVGMLVGRSAHRDLWPRVLRWMGAQARAAAAA